MAGRKIDGDYKEDEQFLYNPQRKARNMETLRRNAAINAQSANQGVIVNDQRDQRQHIDHQHVENHYHLGAVDGARDIAHLLATPSSSVESSSSVAHLDAIMKAAGLILQEISGVYSDHLDVQDIIFAAQAHHTKLSRQTSLILYDLFKFAQSISSELPFISALLKVGEVDAAIYMCTDLLNSSYELENNLQAFVTDFEVIPLLLYKAYGKASRSVSALNHRVANAKMFSNIFGSIGGTAVTVGALSVPVSNGASWRFLMNECSFTAKCGIALMAVIPFAASLWSNRASQKFEDMIEGFEEKMQEILMIHKELDMQTRLLKTMNENLKLAIDSQRKICTMAKMSQMVAGPGEAEVEQEGATGHKLASFALDFHIEKAKSIWNRIAASLQMRDLTGEDEMMKLILECRQEEEEEDVTPDADEKVVGSELVVKPEDSSRLEQEWTSKLSTPFVFKHM